MTALTERQSQILALIKHWVSQNGFPPTRAEIARHFGFASCNAVEDHIKAIASKGYIALTPGISRGIRVIEVAA